MSTENGNKTLIDLPSGVWHVKGFKVVEVKEIDIDEKEFEKEAFAKAVPKGTIFHCHPYECDDEFDFTCEKIVKEGGFRELRDINASSINYKEGFDSILVCLSDD